MVMKYLGDTKTTGGMLADAMKSHTDMDVKGAKPGSANSTGEYGTSLKQLAEYFASNKDYKIEKILHLDYL